MIEIVMPRLSDSMEEGTILAWLKAEGDEIAVGEELVEIETDKSNMVYESDVTGTLLHTRAAEGDTVPIGAVIALVGDPAEDSSDYDGSPAAAPKAEASAEPASAEVAATTPPVADGGSRSLPDQIEADASGSAPPRLNASPLARRAAAQLGVNLEGLTGSGPGGRIVKADVERSHAQAEAAAQEASTFTAQGAATASASEGAKGETTHVELTRLQATVARRMAESKATAPHFYLESEFDMSRCVEARATVASAADPDDPVPSLNDIVVKACAVALREHPRANAAYRDGAIELYSRVNIGIAVAASDALVVPTVFDVDRKGLVEIASETKLLAQRARERTITPPELSGGTFTVSNLGMFGIANFAAVLNPPQAGILAVGAVRKQPVIGEGGIATAHLMRVNLTCDHRVLYGAHAAAFLARLRTILEEPLRLAF